MMDMETKRTIILEARAAVRRGLPASRNPYPGDSEAHAVWLVFYRMSLTDELRDDLIHAEYEASAY